MLNARPSPTFYEFDSGDLLRALPRAGRPRRGARGHLPLPHARREAYPSRTDIELASEPDAHYVLVSTRDPSYTGPGASCGRSGSWTAWSTEEAASRVVESYMFAHTGADDVPDRLTPRLTPAVAARPVPTDLEHHRGHRVHPHHPAHPHRRREVRRGQGRHRRRGDRRPRLPAHRPARPPGHQRQRCTASSTSTSTTRTSASPAAWRPRSGESSTVTILPAVAGGMR